MSFDIFLLSKLSGRLDSNGGAVERTTTKKEKRRSSCDRAINKHPVRSTIFLRIPTLPSKRAARKAGVREMDWGGDGLGGGGLATPQAEACFATPIQFRSPRGT